MGALSRDGDRLKSLFGGRRNVDRSELCLMEGMIGVPTVLKSRSVPYRIVVQQPGTALRIKADVVRKEFDRCGACEYYHLVKAGSTASSANGWGGQPL